LAEQRKALAEQEGKMIEKEAALALQLQVVAEKEAALTAQQDALAKREALTVENERRGKDVRASSEMTEVAALRLKMKEQAVTIETLALLAKQVDTLTARLAASEKRNKSISTDLDFIRQTYNTASDRAVEAVGHSAALEAEIKVLRGQLSVGLKQRDLHNAAFQQRRSAQLHQLQQTNKLLLAQARLTDTVRHKASMYDSVLDDKEALEEDLARTSQRLSRTEDRNEELVSQIEVFRARQMGVLDSIQDDSEDSDYQASHASGSSRSATPGSPIDRVAARTNTSLAAVEQVLTEDGSTKTTSELTQESMWYACKYRQGNDACPAEFENIQVGAPSWYELTGCRVLRRMAWGIFRAGLISRRNGSSSLL
jgi:hypothetical protein